MHCDESVRRAVRADRTTQAGWAGHLLCVVLACALLLTGCGTTTPSPSLGATHDPSPGTPITRYEPSLDTLCVVLPSSRGLYPAASDEALVYVNEMLYLNGFDLTLEYFKLDAVDETVDANFYKYLTGNNIDRNKDKREKEKGIYRVAHHNDNAVFVTYNTLPWIEEVLLLTGLLGDFYELGARYIPEQMTAPQARGLNEPGTLTRIPLQLTKPTFGNPLAVLIREDIAEEYGHEIRTAAEYENLLRWLQARDPMTIPGCALMDDTDRTIPYDLFLPMLWYWQALGDLYTDRFNLLTLGTNNVVPAHTVPEARFAREEFARWRRECLMVMKRGGNFEVVATDLIRFLPVDLTPYPTLLLYANDLMSPPNTLREDFRQLDASGYRMNILYNEQLPRDNMRGAVGQADQLYAFAGHNADLTDFFRPMMWLEDETNYRKLFYGVEGEDYVTQGGRRVYSNTDIDWDGVENCLTFLERAEYKLPPAGLPSNYTEEMAALTPAYEVVLADEDLKRIADWAGMVDNWSTFWACWVECDKLDRALCLDNPLPTSVRVRQLIGAYEYWQQSREDILLEYTELIQDAMSRAAVR